MPLPSTGQATELEHRRQAGWAVQPITSSDRKPAPEYEAVQTNQVDAMRFAKGERIEITQAIGSTSGLFTHDQATYKYTPWRQVRVAGDYGKWVQIDYGPYKGGGRRLECVYKADIARGLVLIKRIENNVGGGDGQ